MSKDYKGIFVYVEQRDRKVQNVSLELIGKAKELAEILKEEVTAVVLGYKIQEQLNNLIQYGADNVIYVDNEKLDIYMTEPYTKAIAEIIKTKKPGIMMYGATAIGRDLAPRVACRIKTGLTADCTGLDINEENNNLMMTRPAFGGNIMATIECPDHRPQMATVRPGVMKKAEFDENKTGNIENIDIDITKEDMTYEIIEVVKEKKEKMDIQEAVVLVSGGRGVGKPEKFELLKNVADELGGMVSASRAVIDSGWKAKDYQVGQTGKTVRPDLYVACGISGAIQHLAGMEESEFIVAINKDATAPIFEVADVGIVGDLNKVLPLLAEEIKKAKLEKYN